MKKLRITAVVLTMVFTMVWCIGAFAASFPDVDSTKYNWATEAIGTMSNEGIIKGYEDGTFGPERVVTKLEALVLVSRILGVNNKENKDIVQNSVFTYEDIINGYELPYGKNEIAYLIAKNIITEDELDDYIRDDNRNEGMKRYEVAVLLTKAMDGEAEIANALTVLDYADASDIPSFARKYVQYVTEKELMQGMGENMFVPNNNVTRAQAAVVLFKLKNITNYEYKSGVVSGVDTASKIVRIKDALGDTYANTISSNVIVRIDGKKADIKDISVAMNAVITYKDAAVYSIDLTHPLIDDVVNASFIGHSTTKKEGTVINVYTYDENSTDIVNDTKESFKLADDFVITYDGSTSTLGSLKSGNHLLLTVKGGKVTAIDANAKNRNVSGKIKSIEISPVFTITIENSKGETESYIVLDDVTVNKNGAETNGASLMEGDNVSLTLTYNKVSKVIATSKTSSKAGVLSEIVISNNPKLTVTIDGNDYQYPLTTDAEIIVNGSEATIYDLRNGVAVDIKIESDTITKVSTKAAVSGNSQITGKVESVNTSLDLIQIAYTDPELGTTRVDPVYVSKATIFDNATSKTKKLSDVKVGKTVTVIGSVNTGVFVATTVVMID